MQKKHLKRDFILYLFANLIYKGVQGIATILLARYFIPEDYGILRTLIAFTILIGIIINWGLNDYFLYKASQKNKNHNIKNIIGTYITFFLLIYPLAIIMYIIFYKQPLVFILIAYLKILFDWIIDIIVKSLQAKNKFTYVSIVVLLNTSIIGIPVILVYLLHLSLLAYLIALISTTLITVFISIALYHRFFHIKELMPNIKIHKNILVKSLPFFISSFTVYIYLQSDILMLGYFKSPTEVAKYTAATAIIFATYIFPTVIYNFFLPKLINFFKSTKNFISLYRKFIVLVLLIILPIAFILFWQSELVLHILYGNKYLDSVLILKILTIVLFLHSFAYVSGAILTASKQQHLRATIQLIAACINIGLNLFFIPRWGAEGAASTTLITEIILISLYMFYTIKTLNKLKLTRNE